MQTVRMIFKFCQEQKWGTSQVRKCKQQPMKQWQRVPVGEKSIRGMCYWKCTSLWIVGLKESSTELEALKTQALECGIWACGLLRHRGEAHLGPSTTPLTGNTIFEQRCFHDWWVSIPYTLFFCSWNMSALRWTLKVLHSYFKKWGHRCWLHVEVMMTDKLSHCPAGLPTALIKK